MKNKLYTTLTTAFIAGGFLLSACGDNILDTQSPSSMDDKNIFSIYDLAIGTINNIYTYYGEQNHRARYFCYYGMNTDIEWLNGSDGGDDKANMVNYNTLPNNGQLNIADAKEPWSNIYSGIEKANLAIEGLQAYADLENDEGLRQLYGEALTLRAIAYIDLINAWGDVPARFVAITPETINLPREDRDVIYKQIIADLQTAQEYVAWPNERSDTQTVERINKAFVKGFLARVCMQAAGYSLRSDGTVRQSSDPDLSVSVLYPIALQACKEVMDQEGRYVALKSNFVDVFKGNCQDDIAAGGESLWEVPYANSPSARGRMVYTYGTKHEAIDQFVKAKQGGQVGPLPNVFFDYSIKDKRRDVTCVPYTWVEKNAGSGVAVQELSTLKSWYFGKMRYEWMTRGASISSTDDGINKIYMRYADVVLMRAELEKAFPDRFNFVSDRDYADYIYLRSDLSTLKGKKFQPKRNHLNKFRSNYPNYTYKPLTSDLIPACLELETQWCRANNCAENQALENERRSMTAALQHLEQLDVIGGVLYVEDEIVAFTFGAPINQTTFDTCVEKANTAVEGAYAMINYEFANHIPSQYIYINREEDLGLEGLRKAKLSYQPEVILEKYMAELK